MAINALIAGGITPVQTTSIADREAKRAMTDGQLRMNALNDDKLRENAYAIQQRNALNEGWAAENAQPGSGAARLAALGQASAIPAMNKTRTEQETAELTNRSTATKLYTDNMAVNYDKLRLVNSPEALDAWVEGMATDPVIGPRTPPERIAAFRAEIAAAKQDPARFADLMQRLRLTGKEYIAQTTQTFEQSEADKLQREQIASGDGRAKGQLGLGYAQLAAQKEESERRAREAGGNPDVTPEQEAYNEGLKAEAKKLGAAQAAAKVKLPSALSNAELVLSTIDELIGDANVNTNGEIVVPKGGRKPADGFESYVGATLLPGMSRFDGTSEAGFKSRLEQIMGGSFLEAYDTLRGGGHITNIEGAKATAARNRMSAAISEVEFIKAAREYAAIVRKGMERAQSAGSIGLLENPNKKPTPASNRKPLTDILGE